MFSRISRQALFLNGTRYFRLGFLSSDCRIPLRRTLCRKQPMNIQTPPNSRVLQRIAISWLVLLVYTSADSSAQSELPALSPTSQTVQLVVLGIAQDAGFPQAGCQKSCCEAAWNDPSKRRMVSCVAVVDSQTQRRYLFDCTPNFPDQLRLLDEIAPARIEANSPITNIGLDGIFLTHAHIGHYTGLMHLGREAMGTSQVPVYGMPRMRQFLKTSGPWSQLVKLNNIELKPITAGTTIRLDRISVTPFLVPHRDEYSETVGFRIDGPHRSALFLPDIDKWSKWDQSIEKMLADVDVAYLDGTFFENGEIPGRDMSLIPHPFVTESINRFSPLDETQRKKVRFIHLNHTNPALTPNSQSAAQVRRAGMKIAVEGESFEL